MLSSWWLNQPFWKKKYLYIYICISQIGSFPQSEHIKKMKPPPSYWSLLMLYKTDVHCSSIVPFPFMFLHPWRFSATGPPETGAMATYAWMKTSLGILAYVFSPPVAQAHRGQKAHCASWLNYGTSQGNHRWILVKYHQAVKPFLDQWSRKMSMWSSPCS